jgi:hypothetical protein
VDLSPFPHQGPLEPHQVKGRDDLVADLTERLTARRVTALLGPRRFGKTSVLVRVADDMARAGTSVVWVDLYEVTSFSDIALRFDAALSEAIGPVRGRLSKIAASVDLTLGFLKVGFARRREERPEPLATLHLLLDALVAAADDHATVVVFDEFPGIVRVDGAAALLRTKLQHRFQTIGIVFAGSQPSLMRAMFSDKAMPFYSQADLVAIGPFDAATITDIVDDGFRSTGRDPGNVAAAIAAFTGGHPHRTMQLADAAWREAAPGAPYEQRVWESAVAAVRAGTDLANETVFSGFQHSEKTVLRLLASNESLFGAAAELLGLSRGSAQHARERLLASGDIVLRGAGDHAVADPVLADWIRRRLPA